MKTVLWRKVALFFLLGSTVLVVSPRSLFASNGSWNNDQNGGNKDGSQEQREDRRSDRERRRDQSCQDGAKPCRNMHPELQIAEPFNRSHDADQGE